MRVVLVPDVSYRATCRTCGWQGETRRDRKDADLDAEYHAYGKREGHAR